MATLTAKAKIYPLGKIISLEAKGVDKKLKSETGENINLMTKKNSADFYYSWTSSSQCFLNCYLIREEIKVIKQTDRLEWTNYVIEESGNG